MLARITDPFSTLSRLSDDFFGLSRYPEEKYTFRPDVDIYEDEKAIYLKAELAGMSVDDIKIDVGLRPVLSLNVYQTCILVHFI